MNILAVTSLGSCGIAEHSELVAQATFAAAPTIHFQLTSEALDPAWVFSRGGLDAEKVDCVWLNHHDGLHSRWTPEHVSQLHALGIKVVVTYHDTYDGEVQANSVKAHALHDVADAFIVHEPVADLPKAIYLRQGVPPAALEAQVDHSIYSWTRGRPVLGTAGFNFPWKNYDRLCAAAAQAGWAVRLCCNNATEEDIARWHSLNQCVEVLQGFLPTRQIVSYLTGCDATVFAYECANAGTSGAIRLGLAARKPLIAFEGCRQFRDLKLAERDVAVIYGFGIRWTQGFDGLFYELCNVVPARVDPSICWHAHRDSWENQGKCYAEIFRSVVNG